MKLFREQGEQNGIAEIKSVCEYVDTHLDTRVLILTAVDPAFFSSGNVKDMKELKGMLAGTPAELVEQYRKNLQEVMLSVYNVEIPPLPPSMAPLLEPAAVWP